MLALLRKKYEKIVLEVEPPYDEMKRRRIAFYERQGFCQNDYPYVQPPYREGETGVELILMSLPSPLSDCGECIKEMYEKVYKTTNR